MNLLPRKNLRRERFLYNKKYNGKGFYIMKKFIATILALMLVVSLATAAMAAEETGTITVENAVAGQDYALYQLAVLESFSGNSFSYKYVAAWEDFFAAHSSYFELDGEYVKVKDDLNLTDAQKMQLSKDAHAYAGEKKIDAIATKTAQGDAVVFDGLSLGYYLLDSSMGTLCTLDTSTKEVTISEKNAEPTMIKQVEEDSKVKEPRDGSEWGEVNDADFYQTVNYKVVITAQAGAQNYVLHDVMEAGLTLNDTSIRVFKADGETVAAANYTVKTSGLTDGCTFEVVFAQEYCDTLTADQQIVVTYSAYLNENAVIAGQGNKNTSWMTYGEKSKTTESITTTYVYEFDIIKTDADNVLLSGAKFKLYDAAGEEIAVVKEADGSYRLAKDGENGVEIEVAGGKVTVTGLDGGTTYALEETVAPEGYNKLSARQSFAITSENLKAAIEGTNYADGGVQVVNKTGSELPETGGLGTLLFTLLGGGTVLGSGVLLVTKKRMSKIEE